MYRRQSGDERVHGFKEQHTGTTHLPASNTPVLAPYNTLPASTHTSHVLTPAPVSATVAHQAMSSEWDWNSAWPQSDGTAVALEPLSQHVLSPHQYHAAPMTNEPGADCHPTHYQHAPQSPDVHDHFYQQCPPLDTTGGQVYQQVQPVSTVNNQAYQEHQPVSTVNNQACQEHQPVSTVNNQAYQEHQPGSTVNNQVFQEHQPVSTVNNQAYQEHQPVSTQVFQEHQPVSTVNNQAYQEHQPVSTVNNQAYQEHQPGSTQVFQEHQPVSTVSTQVFQEHQPVSTVNNQAYQEHQPVSTVNNQAYQEHQPVSTVNNQAYQQYQPVSDISSQFYQNYNYVSTVNSHVHQDHQAISTVRDQLNQDGQSASNIDQLNHSVSQEPSYGFQCVDASEAAVCVAQTPAESQHHALPAVAAAGSEQSAMLAAAAHGHISGTQTAGAVSAASCAGSCDPPLPHGRTTTFTDRQPPSSAGVAELTHMVAGVTLNAAEQHHQAGASMVEQRASPPPYQRMSPTGARDEDVALPSQTQRTLASDTVDDRPPQQHDSALGSSRQHPDGGRCSTVSAFVPLSSAPLANDSAAAGTSAHAIPAVVHRVVPGHAVDPSRGGVAQRPMVADGGEASAGVLEARAAVPGDGAVSHDDITPRRPAGPMTTGVAGALTDERDARVAAGPRSETIGSEDGPVSLPASLSGVGAAVDAVADVGNAVPAATAETADDGVRRGDGEDKTAGQQAAAAVGVSSDDRSVRRVHARHDSPQRRSDHYRRSDYDPADHGYRDRDRDRDYRHSDREYERDYRRRDHRDRYRDRDYYDRNYDDEERYFEGRGSRRYRHRYDSGSSRRDDEFDERDDRRFSRDHERHASHQHYRRGEREEADDRRRYRRRRDDGHEYYDRPPSVAASEHASRAGDLSHQQHQQQHAAGHVRQQRQRLVSRSESLSAALSSHRATYDDRTLMAYFSQLERMRASNTQLFTRQMMHYRSNNPVFYRELCSRYYRPLLQQQQQQQQHQQLSMSASYPVYAGSDERASVHSGRSSLNETGAASLATNNVAHHYVQHNTSVFAEQFRRQRPGSAGHDDCEPSAILQHSSPYVDQQASLYGQYECQQQPSSLVHSTVSASVTQPERLTPAKFNYPHIIGRFCAGGELVVVQPHCAADGGAALVDIHDTSVLLQDCDELREMKRFPGPLHKSVSHKNVVLQYCQTMVRDVQRLRDSRATLLASDAQLDTATAAADIDTCCLLWQLLQLMIRQDGVMTDSSVAELLLNSGGAGAGTVSSGGALTVPGQGSCTGNATAEAACTTTSASAASSTTASSHDEVVIDQYTELLLYGRQKEAIEFALRRHLWGHALLLASSQHDGRVMERVRARVLVDMTASSHCLQTLYQLLAGRLPLSTTMCGDDAGGEWRPHLVMLLSNSHSHPDLSRRSIITMADALASRGHLYASHFCYLVAQCGLDVYTPGGSGGGRLVLLGASAGWAPAQLCNSAAIRRTELLEYARSLAGGAPLPHFQVMKYLYATRLLDYGLADEAVKYCENIASIIVQHPTLFHLSLVSQVYWLSCSLKMHDAQYQPADMASTADQWLPEWLQSLQVVFTDMQSGRLAGYPAVASGFDGSGTVLPDAGTSAVDGVVGETADCHAAASQQPVSSHHPAMMYQPPAHQQMLQPCESVVAPSSLPYDASSHATAVATTSTPHDTAGPGFYDPSQYGQQQQQQQDQHQHSYWNSWNYSQSMPALDEPEDVNAVSGVAQSANQPRADDLHNDDQRGSSTLQQQQQNVPPAVEPAPPQQQQPPKQQQSTSTTQQQAGSWLGGLFSKFSKAKNQMILPDDSNKTIVWSEERGCWVDTSAGADDDASGTGSGSRPPPPSDLQLASSSPVVSSLPPANSSLPPANSSLPPANSSLPAATPSAGQPGNKFKIPKGRGMRANYVDVLGGGGGGVTTPAQSPLVPSPGPLAMPAVDSGADTYSAGSVHDTAGGGGTVAPPGEQVASTPLMMNPSQVAPAPMCSSTSNRLGRYGRR